MSRRRTNSTLLSSLLLVACSSGPCAKPEETPDFSGFWRAALDGPGGEVPFGLSLQNNGQKLIATLINGRDRKELDAVELRGKKLRIAIDAYDGHLDLKLQKDGTLAGKWVKTAQGGQTVMELRAARGNKQDRFPPLADREAQADPKAVALDPSGRWKMELTMPGETIPAIAELKKEEQSVQGNVITPVGDFGELEGTFERGVLRLSRFDGANAILIRGRTDAIGGLSGQVWIGTEATQRFTASRASDEDANFVKLSPAAGRIPQIAFKLTDLEGREVRSDDPLFAGKVVVVDVMGTWCVTCVDQAPILSRWQEQYGPKGLQIVSVAFEVGGDAARDRAVVAAYKNRHKLTHPFLIGGPAGEEKKYLGVEVDAYPTTFFLGRDGRVKHVHRGFVGPSAGEHHQRLIAEMERLIESLLAGTSTTSR